MKITGTNSYIEFDMENGRVLKAEGEILTDRRFVVYTETSKWLSPHEGEVVSKEDIENLIKEVRAMSNSSTIQLLFE